MENLRILILHLSIVFLITFSTLNPLAAISQDKSGSEDQYFFLEESKGANALQWVEEQNQLSLAKFESDPVYHELLDTAQNVLNDTDRIPLGDFLNGHVYNFWRDENNIKGVLRRTTFKEYSKDNPSWEILLDIDRLSQNESTTWVYEGRTCLAPEYERCLITLSEKGRDAVEVREYDLARKRFVEKGFYLKEFKSRFDWWDENTILVATDFGDDSLTESKNPRIVKVLQRGQLIESAQTVFEGKKSDVNVTVKNYARPEGGIFLVEEFKSTFKSEKWLLNNDLTKTRIQIPDDSEIFDFFKGYLIIRLNSDWVIKTPGHSDIFNAGSLVSVKLKPLIAGELSGNVNIMYEPDKRSSITEALAGRDSVIVNTLENVKGKVLEFTFSNLENGPLWKLRNIELPENGITSIVSSNPFFDEIVVSYEGFLTPKSLFMIKKAGKNPEEIKSMPHKFDSGKLLVEQKQATSSDGTKIPYFIVRSKNLKFDGSNPTMLHAYGGFNVPRLPQYSVTLGRLWLERGGVFVLANIRGGGEFGPSWHEQAVREKRQNSFNDFIAVAEDIVNQGVTSPGHLGIMGGSNGGLLVGVMFTQRPDLVNAVVCSSPLLDMLRYTKMLPEVGASWIEEYGDPDSEQTRPFLAAYSPYHNLHENVQYPKVLFLTSTEDDRVNPGHARKMAKKMLDMGNEVEYFENTSGGHKTYSDNYERARMFALQYSFLLRNLQGKKN